MTSALAQVARTLEEHGDPTREWLIGTPWFRPPRDLLTSLRRAVSGRAGYPYPPAPGDPDFRRAIAEFHTKTEWTLSPEQVVATHGAKGGLLAVMGLLVGPGDEVLHPTPCYPAYPAIVSRLGGTPVAIDQPGASFSWSRKVIEGRITERTRALVLSSPANPNGAILSEDQARLLVDVCRDHGLRLVCDEAYDAFRHRPLQNSVLPAFWDSTLQTVIRIRSFSKSHSVCGWRLGYVATDPVFSGRVAEWQSAHLNPPNLIAQMALTGAVQPSCSYAQRIARLVRLRLEELASVVSGEGLLVHPPEGGFYLWADVRRKVAGCGTTGSLEFCLDLAHRHGVGLWPGEDFLAPGWVRLSAVGAPQKNWRPALHRLSNALKDHENSNR